MANPHNKASLVHVLFTDTVRMIKSQVLRWVGHVSKWERYGAAIKSKTLESMRNMIRYSISTSPLQKYLSPPVKPHFLSSTGRHFSFPLLSKLTRLSYRCVQSSWYSCDRCELLVILGHALLKTFISGLSSR
jgi:hypothetical protein